MRVVVAALVAVALVSGGCMEDETQPSQPSQAIPPPGPTLGTTGQPPPDDLAGATGATGEYYEPDAFVARAQQRAFEAESIARQLQIAAPPYQDWSALDGSFIEDFVDGVCAGNPEAAARDLMNAGVPNADLRAAPALTQAVLLTSQRCDPDYADLDRASNVMNRYLVAGQQQSELTARQVAAATPAAPSFLERLLGTICKGTVRTVAAKGGAGLLFGMAAGAAVCPGIIDELLAL